MRIVLAVLAALVTLLVSVCALLGAFGERISPEVLMVGAFLATAAVAALVLKRTEKPREGPDAKDGSEKLFGEVMEELKRANHGRFSPTAIFTLSLIASWRPLSGPAHTGSRTRCASSGSSSFTSSGTRRAGGSESFHLLSTAHP